MEKVMKKAITRSAFFIILVCIMALSGSLYASALSNGLNEWDPRSIQGTIMEVGPDYIVVAEKYVYLLNTSNGGKEIKTRIMDGKGIEIEKRALKAGKNVFVKGGMAYDDKRATDVLLAKEVYLLDKQLDLKNNENHRRLFNERSKPW
jgi:hypothetical protein